MEKNETIEQLKIGTWDNLETDTERKPRVEFTIGKSKVITMNCDSPREIPYMGGAFYVFAVREQGEEKEIATSAWSLLRGLKKYEPLNGKILKITKVMEAGKQTYKVEDNEEKI